MYDELKDISYIFYINSKSGKLCTCSVGNKEELDDNGYPRYLGKYGNCLAALKYQRITDKLQKANKNNRKNQRVISLIFGMA